MDILAGNLSFVPSIIRVRLDLHPPSCWLFVACLILFDTVYPFHNAWWLGCCFWTSTVTNTSPSETVVNALQLDVSLLRHAHHHCCWCWWLSAAVVTRTRIERGSTQGSMQSEQLLPWWKHTTPQCGTSEDDAPCWWRHGSVVPWQQQAKCGWSKGGSGSSS